MTDDSVDDGTYDDEAEDDSPPVVASPAPAVVTTGPAPVVASPVPAVLTSDSLPVATAASFSVDTGALVTHANTLSDLTGQLNATLGTAQSATLAPGAFGQFGQGLVPAITSVTTAGQDALGVQVASLDNATSGIRATATAYQQQEGAVAANFNAIGNGLPSQAATVPVDTTGPVEAPTTPATPVPTPSSAPSSTAGLDEAGQPAVPGPDSKPADVNAWWQGLSQDQKQQEATLYSHQIGTLDGVPAAVRDYANRLELPGLIQQTQDQLNQLNANPPQFDPSNPGHADLSGTTDAETKFVNDNLAWTEQVRNTAANLSGLNAIQNVIGPNPPFPSSDVPPPVDLTGGGTPPKYLLGVDTNDLGHAIIASNNPDAASNVATLVPGMNTRLDELNVNWYTQRTDQLVAAATQAGGPSTSVISWLNYAEPPPPLVVNGISSTPAVNAAPALTQFQEGLNVTSSAPAPLMSWIGHSYGTIAIGETALATPGGLGSLGVTNVVVAGSPGMDVWSSSSLGVQNVWATQATNDAIKLTPPVHDISPVDPAFGAHVFDAGVGTPGLFPNRAAHSSYFDVGSPALTNMGNIITGNYGQVTAPPQAPVGNAPWP